MQIDPTPVEATGRRAIRRAFRAMPAFSGRVFRAPEALIASALRQEPLLAALEPVEDGTLVRKHDTGGFE